MRSILLCLLLLPLTNQAQEISIIQPPQGGIQFDSAFSDLSNDPKSSVKHVVIFYGDGRVKHTGMWDRKASMKEGTWRNYYPTGNLQLIEEYVHGQLHGARVSMDGRGSVVKEETYKNGVKHGVFQKYHQGRITLSEMYENGRLTGKKRAYYPGGSIQEEGEYKDGQRQGLTKWYYENQNLLMRSTYSNGQLNGYQKSYHDNGSLREEGNYKNNEKYGLWKEYDEKGRLTKQGEYIHDKKQGNWVSFDEQGKVIKTEKYKGGIKK